MKYLIASIMAVCLIAFAAQATGTTPLPPAYGGYNEGWGMNPTNCTSYTGQWSSGLMLFDPNLPYGGGGSWVVGWGTPLTYVNYGDITLQLWIEMSMYETYWNTSYRWHRLGQGAETITFYINGYAQSNEGCWVSCTVTTPADTTLKFIHNIGVGDDRNVRNIPITWWGQWGTGLTIGSNVVGGWHRLYWDNVGSLDLAELAPGDTWYQFEGTFNLVQYEPDGYYTLVLSGCPSPGM